MTRCPRWVVFPLVLLSACAGIDVNTQVTSKLTNSRKQTSTAPEDEISVQREQQDGKILVHAALQPFCMESGVQTFEDTKVTTRVARSKTAFVVNGVFAALTIGGGIAFMATANGRPLLSDRYSRDELSREGWYGIGAGFLAGGVTFTSLLIANLARTRDTREVLPPRTVAGEPVRAPCGKRKPIVGEMVTLHIPAIGSHGTAADLQATTNDEGTALIVLSQNHLEGRSAVDVANASVVVRDTKTTIDLRDNPAYGRAVAATAQHAEEQELQKKLNAELAAKKKVQLVDAIRSALLSGDPAKVEALLLGAEPVLNDSGLIARFEGDLKRLTLALKARDEFKARLTTKETWLVMSEDSALRELPSQGAPEAGRGKRGLRVRVVATAGAFIAVARAEGEASSWANVDGWIPRAATMSAEKWTQVEARERVQRLREERRAQEHDADRGAKKVFCERISNALYDSGQLALEVAGNLFSECVNRWSDQQMGCAIGRFTANGLSVRDVMACLKAHPYRSR